MTLRLSKPLSDYFTAADAHDIPRMLAVFSDGAVVVDEGQQHSGLSAIREWMADTVGRYAFTIAPVEIAITGHETVLTASVSGTFPGSPITLQYRFTIDAGKITGLEIG